MFSPSCAIALRRACAVLGRDCHASPTRRSRDCARVRPYRLEQRGKGGRDRRRPPDRSSEPGSLRGRCAAPARIGQTAASGAGRRLGAVRARSCRACLPCDRSRTRRGAEGAPERTAGLPGRPGRCVRRRRPDDMAPIGRRHRPRAPPARSEAARPALHPGLTTNAGTTTTSSGRTLTLHLGARCEQDEAPGGSTTARRQGRPHAAASRTKPRYGVMVSRRTRQSSTTATAPTSPNPTAPSTDSRWARSTANPDVVQQSRRRPAQTGGRSDREAHARGSREQRGRQPARIPPRAPR